MPKRKWECEDKVEESGQAWDGKDEHDPRLPKTPATQKRPRRNSDVIDSIGSTGFSLFSPSIYNSRTTATSTTAAATTVTELTDSPTHMSTSSSPANSTTPVRRSRARQAHWKGLNKDSSRMRESTPDLLPSDYYASRSFSHDAGPTTPMIPFPVPGVSGTISVHKDAESYNMSHPQRGKCIIFNHENFDTGFEPRVGSTFDAQRIQQTFQNLGFVVEVYKDFEFANIMQKVDQVSAENHSQSDCVCIFILTHGLKNNHVFARDVAYNLERVWKPFTAERSVTLASKPKLFFLQACRGNGIDEGIRLYTTRKTEADSNDTYKVPTHADFLFAHSTVEDFVSWRDPTRGTWYIQTLCDVLDEHATKMDLNRMLTITARRVAMDFASHNPENPMMHELKQVPMVTSTLIRDLYFTPKTE